MHPLVSVLMPVFNTESYLNRAIDSVLTQTYKNIELVIIDDGSTDGSSAILDGYSKADSRIVLIHQSNKGVAYSKKKLLSEAKGEYVVFVDSDDWLDLNAIADMLDIALREKSDLVITDYWIDTPLKKEIIIQQPKELSSHSIFLQLCKGETHGILCNKLFKKTKALSNIFENVPQHITYREDTWICGHLLNNDIKISYIPKAYYHWFIDRPGNSSSSTSPKKLHLSIEVYEELERLLDDSDKSVLYTRKKDVLLDAFLSKQFGLLKDSFPEIKAKIINDARYLNYLTPQSKCLALALKGHPHFAYALYHVIIDFIQMKEKIGL